MIACRTIAVKNLVTPSKLPGVDAVINPYVGCPHRCVYCYAEFMQRFSGHCEAWGDFLDIKQDWPALSPAKLAGKRLVMSSVTDPYNAFERRYGVTRRILEQLQDCAVHLTIITKSDLVLRDIDLIARLPNAEVALSLNSLDDAFRRRFEPRAPQATRRLAALRRLHDAGIRTILFMSPIFPGITDWRALLDAAAGTISESWFENLNLRNGAHRPVARAIGRYYPALIPLYRRLYRDGNPTYWPHLARLIGQYGEQHRLACRILFH